MESHFEKYITMQILYTRSNHDFSKYIKLIDESGTIEKIINIFSEIKQDILSTKIYDYNIIYTLLCNYSKELSNLAFPEFPELSFSKFYEEV